MLRLRLLNTVLSKNQISLTSFRGQKSLTSDIDSNLERTRSVTSFYYQNAIDAAAARVGSIDI